MTARYLFFTILWLVALAAVLLVAGGDLRWPEAWVFAAEYIVCSGAVVVWLARHDPALLRERFAPPVHRDQSLWDRIFFLALIPAFIGWLVLLGLDARRFGWSHMPVALEIVGALAFAASMFVTWLVFRTNSFAVPQARLQAERAQRVIDTGPLRLRSPPNVFGRRSLLCGDGAASRFVVRAARFTTVHRCPWRSDSRRGADAEARARRVRCLCRAGALASRTRRLVTRRLVTGNSERRGLERHHRALARLDRGK